MQRIDFSFSPIATNGFFSAAIRKSHELQKEQGCPAWIRQRGYKCLLLYMHLFISLIRRFFENCKVLDHEKICLSQTSYFGQLIRDGDHKTFLVPIAVKQQLTTHGPDNRNWCRHKLRLN